MKIRISFVSNSSSASFVASLSKLSDEEREKIIKYCSRDNKENEDGWRCQIDEEAGLLMGYTIMDNEAIHKFLEKEGINKVRITDEGM